MKDAIDYAYRKAAKAGSAMALGAMMIIGASALPAAAQSRPYYPGRNFVQSNRRVTASDIRRIGTINGYQEGYEDGLQARSRRSSYNYQDADMYRRGDFGFQSTWGESRIYQSAFRDGYKRGYSDGFYSRRRNRGYDRSQITVYYPNGYPTYYRNATVSSDFSQRATQQGYYDGFYRGQYDRQNRVKRPNPQGHGAYEFALNGWEEDWGNQSAYQQAYRQYFLEGYQDGYGNRAFRQNYRPRY